MQDCTHLSRFAIVSRFFPDRYAKKYTGYCIIACVPMWLRGKDLARLAVMRKMLRAYAIPCIFRPLRKKRGCCIRPRRRSPAFPSLRSGSNPLPVTEKDPPPVAEDLFLAQKEGFEL